jgi:hypothetical protein
MKRIEILIVVAIIMLVIGMFLFQPYMEMRTFNKFSNGKKANIVDAMFAKLRIEACK